MDSSQPAPADEHEDAFKTDDGDDQGAIAVPTGLEPGPQFGQLRPRPHPVLSGSNIYRLPSFFADGGMVGDWWVSGASRAGVSHLQHGVTNHDSYSFILGAGGDSVVVAVADGLGSRPTTSQIGSTLVARFACEALAKASAEEFNRQPIGMIKDALVIANGRLSESGKMLRVETCQLSTTLVLARVPLVGQGPIVLARVGDCAAFLDKPSAAEGEHDLFRSVFPRGAGALNAVDSYLPADEPEVEFSEVEIDTSTYLVLTSDGLANDMFTSAEVRRWLHGQWAPHLGASEMAHSLEYARQGSHDDRTALIARLDPLAGGRALVPQTGRGQAP